MAQEREYKIDIGNSNTGQIGLVAYVDACSKKEALEKFKKYFASDGSYQMHSGMNLYINVKAITLKEVELAD